MDTIADHIVNTTTVKQQVERYETFIHNVLRPDLYKLHQRYEKIAETLTEYTTIKGALTTLVDNKMKSFKSMTDLGCNVYVKCVIPDAEYVYLNIGKDCFVQFKLAEAIDYIEQIIAAFKPQSDALLESMAKIKAHIKLVMNLIDQLRTSQVQDDRR